MQDNKPRSGSKPKGKTSKPLQLALSFLLGLMIGLIIARPGQKDDKIPANLHEVRQGGYRFINPLLECEAAPGPYNKELKNFKYKINELVNSKLSNRMASHISVYFRDLNNGPWFGINEKEDFSPASLLKIPVMISLLKRAESDPQTLERTIKYEAPIYILPQDVEPKEVIRIGESYTIKDLIYRMIVYSDNEAKNLLILDMDQDLLNKTYLDLSIDIPNVRNPEDFMSVKSYASFFRILYNASYLNKEMSEFALEILSNADFKDGLIAGVPKGTLVAQKFGERSFNGIKQLHDCGIVYHKDHPYLLCVMTRGENFKQLANIIKDISFLVYSEVDSQYR